MKTGQVILVGAGPGDPELMTLGGRKAIEGSRPWWSMTGWWAGKSSRGSRRRRSASTWARSPRTTPCRRSGISEILLEKALEGKRVVRLKGGDPFLFGRGGEELELLAEHGVPFRGDPRG